MSIMGGWSEATEWLTEGRADGWDKVSHLWNGPRKKGEEVIVLKEIDKLIPFLAFGETNKFLKELGLMLC